MASGSNEDVVASVDSCSVIDRNRPLIKIEVRPSGDELATPFSLPEGGTLIKARVVSANSRHFVGLWLSTRETNSLGQRGACADVVEKVSEIKQR